MAEAFRFRIHQHGPAGSPVREAFVPTEPKPGWVRIGLQAMALNHLDLWTTFGLPGYPLPLPLTPGSDGAGTLEALGEGTVLPPGVDLGGSVMIAPGLSCGVCPACLRGDDMLCGSYGVLGHICDGTAATHVLVPAANLLPIPATGASSRRRPSPWCSSRPGRCSSTRRPCGPGRPCWSGAAAVVWAARPSSW